MEVILLQKMRNLGQLGDTVTVRPGFARNYLIPTARAIPATDANRAVFQKRRAELESAQNNALDAAKKRASAVAGVGTVTIAVRAAEEGKLYGSVANLDIVESLQKAGVNVEKSEIQLPNGPIRHVGEYEIDIQLHTDVTATIQLKVVAA